MKKTNLAPNSKVDNTNVISGRKKYKFAFKVEHSNIPHLLLGSPNGEYCFVSSESEHILVNCLEWSTQTVKLEKNTLVKVGSFRLDCKLLVLGCSDNMIRVVELSSRRILSSFPCESAPKFVGFSKNSSELLIIMENELIIKDTLGNLRSKVPLPFSVIQVCNVGSDIYLLSPSNIYVISPDPFEILNSTEVTSSTLLSASDNGLIALESEGLIQIRYCKEQNLMAQFRPHLKGICFLKLSKNGRLLYSASLDGVLSVTDVFSKKSQILLKTSLPIVKVEFSGDRIFALGTNDGSVIFYQEQKKIASATKTATRNVRGPKIDSLLKKFEYLKALELAIGSEDIDVLVSLLEKLQYCQVLQRCMDNLNNSFIEKLQDVAISTLAKSKRISFALNILHRLIQNGFIETSVQLPRLKSALDTTFNINCTFISLGSQIDIIDLLS